MILSVGPHDISGCIKCNWLTFLLLSNFVSALVKQQSMCVRMRHCFLNECRHECACVCVCVSISYRDKKRITLAFCWANESENQLFYYDGILSTINSSLAFRQIARMKENNNRDSFQCTRVQQQMLENIDRRKWEWEEKNESKKALEK